MRAWGKSGIPLELRDIVCGVERQPQSSRVFVPLDVPGRNSDLLDLLVKPEQTPAAKLPVAAAPAARPSSGLAFLGERERT
jgi:hypothetical protein